MVRVTPGDSLRQLDQVSFAVGDPTQRVELWRDMA